MHKKGVSLLEILVSVVILAIGVGGLGGIFVASKNYIQHSKSRIAGGELGKLFLSPLQMAVREDTWDTSENAINIGTTWCDSVAGHTQNPALASLPADARKLNNIPYTAQYEASDFQLDPINNPNIKLRKVITTISWTEIKP
ncbi:MAG: prepilin-type N-terminal cleavage/methylation domain-containing protein [Candidatus Omnitrophica bacterium]|jgi:prepilin-type N-terminal cleavage/methylation domain-containing protein|nr:prepilin-type N-terminal cleavage/methylation domain-containing protein [Candidatus Omnitrophota bacterium]